MALPLELAEAIEARLPRNHARGKVIYGAFTGLAQKLFGEWLDAPNGFPVRLDEGLWMFLLRQKNFCNKELDGTGEGKLTELLNEAIINWMETEMTLDDQEVDELIESLSAAQIDVQAVADAIRQMRQRRGTTLSFPLDMAKPKRATAAKAAPLSQETMDALGDL